MAAMWTFALARLAGILLLGLCAGLLVGPIWLWILGAACFYLAWQLLNLYRVDRWLRLRSQIDPPRTGGIWGDIVAQVVRLHRRKQYHKQRLVQLYRELRRSTAALTEAFTPRIGSGRASWNHRMQTGGPSPAPVQRAPRRPALGRTGMMLKPPANGMYRSVPGNRPRSAFRSTLAKSVLRRAGFALGNYCGDGRQGVPSQ